MTRPDDNANVTFNGKTLFDGAADTSTTVEQTVVKALNSEWIDSSLELIKETYGISFQDDSATVRDMNLIFEYNGADALAYVEHAYNSKGDATKLTLSVNLDFYKDMDQTDPNGYTSASAGNLDRTIAHEFTHAVMAANINNFHSLPKYIKEGAAEYTHGIDDFRKYTIDNSFNEAMIDDVMTTNRSTSDQEKPYVVGYAFLHYLNAKSGHDGMAMKRMMSELVAKGGSQAGLDAAVAAASNAGFRFQIGTKANQNIFAAFSDIHANALGVRSDEGKNVSVATRADAKRAMTIFDRSIRKALDQATTIGALASRMEYTQSNLTTAAENVQASESTLRDADMAKEMTNYTRDNVLAQAAQSMLAQANQSSSGVLSLLQ